MGKLLPADVVRIIRPGKYPDGDGLYLQVSGADSKSWLYRYTLKGTQRWAGLGSVRNVTLSKARAARDKLRVRVREGIDPIATKRNETLQERIDAARNVTFKQSAEELIEDKASGWRNDKHRAQWKSTLLTYAYPIIGKLPVSEIDTPMVLKCLRPIWTTKTETANRVRGRIESVLDAARVKKQRQGDNPARLCDIETVLGKLKDIRKIVHHPALAFADTAAFMVSLRSQQGSAARALEFTILTAARTGDTIGARWQEIDLAGKAWTVPAERMKAKREHRVPLSDRTLEILAALPREGEFVFPGGRPGNPLSNMAMAKVLERMDRAQITTHGFRSTFRDWAAERTNFPNMVVEMALAHAIDSKVEAAYRRGDLFDKRRRLMDAWAEFCSKAPAVGEVVELRATR
jgi:integrase